MKESSLPIPRLKPSSSARLEVSLAQECVWVGCAATLIVFVALAYCMRHGMLLLYGDAVAHLHIARRLGDSIYPGFRQLGSVWLPLPHLLMYPLAQSMHMWQTGLAGAPPSMAAYALGAAGIYRLARFALAPAPSLLAAAFFALDPNLLYLATTAMTEPIFLAEMIWAAVFVLEHGAAANEPNRPGETNPARERRLTFTLLGLAGVLVCAVFTRYDGWVFAALAWTIVGWRTLRTGAWRGRSGGAFVLGTALVCAAPLLWLAYNARQFGDPLDFMRGPYSAAAIDARTSAHGAGHYPGWHKPWVAILYFLKAGELDATTQWVTDILLVVSLVGTWVALRTRRGLLPVFALFWLPVPFYVYSVAYGSVPIFLPRWYPHGWYNTRYGMELLPVFALALAFAASDVARRFAARKATFAGTALAVASILLVVNDITILRGEPLVLGEARVNSSTRIPFETALAHTLDELPSAGLILMYTSDHVGAIQDAGIPLSRTINDSDWTPWQKALKDPAQAAKFVVALDGDAVSKAVAAHPDGLKELDVICTLGQPCAHIYQSTVPRTY